MRTLVLNLIELASQFETSRWLEWEPGYPAARFVRAAPGPVSEASVVLLQVKPVSFNSMSDQQNHPYTQALVFITAPQS